MTKKNIINGFLTVFGIAMACMILAQIVAVIYMFSTVGILGMLAVVMSIYLYLHIINRFGDEIKKEKENG
jgi:hypothetical protein